MYACVRARSFLTLKGAAGVEIDNSLVVDGELRDVVPGDVGVGRHLVEWVMYYELSDWGGGELRSSCYREERDLREVVYSEVSCMMSRSRRKLAVLL